MNKIAYLFSLLSLLLFVPSLQAELPTIELRKEVRKSFSAEQGHQLRVVNSYGNINIQTHSKKIIEFFVEIKVNSSNSSKAKQKLDEVSISFSEGPNYVKAETKIEESKSWWPNFSWGDNNADMEINYNIKVPERLFLELTQKYGNIYMPNYIGSANVDVKYGNFEGANLKGAMDLTVKYGNGKMGEVQSINIDAGYGTVDLISAQKIDGNIKYGGVNVSNFDEITLQSKYSNYKLGTGKKLNFTGAYDNVKVRSIDQLALDNKYADISIQNFRGRGTLRMDYSKVNIEEFGTGDITLDITGKYTTTKIFATAGYRVDVTGKYMTPVVRGDFTEQSRVERDQHVSLTGLKNQKPYSALVKINSSYGNVYLE